VLYLRRDPQKEKESNRKRHKTIYRTKFPIFADDIRKSKEKIIEIMNLFKLTTEFSLNSKAFSFVTSAHSIVPLTNTKKLVGFVFISLSLIEQNKD